MVQQAVKGRKVQQQSPQKGAARPQRRPDGLETVFHRNLFYVEGYRRSQKINVLLGCIAAVAIVAASYGLSTQKPQYFFTGADGRIIPAIATSEPYRSIDDVMAFAQSAFVKAHTYDWLNYRTSFTEASKFFSAEGWEGFKTAVMETGTLDAVRKWRYVVSTAVTGAPVRTKEGEVGGVYKWTIEIPYKSTFVGSENRRYVEGVATVIVTRINTLEDPRGIGVERMIVRAGGTAPEQ